MSELKGSLMGQIIYVIFIVPFLLLMMLLMVHNTSFMKNTTDFTVMVGERGYDGNTHSIYSALTKTPEIASVGQYTIRVSPTPERGKYLPLGTNVTIQYEYKYKDVFGKARKMTRTDNTVVKQRKVPWGV